MWSRARVEARDHTYVGEPRDGSMGASWWLWGRPGTRHLSGSADRRRPCAVLRVTRSDDHERPGWPQPGWVIVAHSRRDKRQRRAGMSGATGRGGANQRVRVVLCRTRRGPVGRSWKNVLMVVAKVELDGRSIDVARLAEVCRRFGIAELAVFGSVARGEGRDDSDVDLLYVLQAGARLGFAIDALEDELAAVFGRRVDLVARKALHPLLRDDVERQARTLYAA